MDALNNLDLKKLLDNMASEIERLERIEMPDNERKDMREAILRLYELRILNLFA